jgi:hypothetical protein
MALEEYPPATDRPDLIMKKTFIFIRVFLFTGSRSCDIGAKVSSAIIIVVVGYAWNFCNYSQLLHKISFYPEVQMIFLRGILCPRRCRVFFPARLKAWDKGPTRSGGTISSSEFFL